MKTVLLIAALYEGLIGASEILWVPTASQNIAAIAALPSAASVFDSQLVAAVPNGTNYLEGGIDLAIAGLLLWWAK